MAIKIGNSWVSEAAYAYAQEKVAERTTEETSGGSMLHQLSDKFPDLKFTTNTAPYSGNGKNNMAIAPNIFKEMENDPEKRMEYEALIYDCNNVQKEIAKRDGLISFGFILNSDGTLGAWSVSKAGTGNQRSRLKLDKTDKDNWADRILEKSKLKKAEQKKVEQKKAEKKKTEQAAEKKAQEEAAEKRAEEVKDVKDAKDEEGKQPTYKKETGVTGKVAGRTVDMRL